MGITGYIRYHLKYLSIAMVVLSILFSGTISPLLTLGALQSQASLSSNGSIKVQPSPTPTPTPSPTQPPTQQPSVWNGVGSDYKVTMDNTAPIQTVLNQWSPEITRIKADGFNTVRLAFAMRSQDHHSVMVYSDMDQVIDLLGRNGIYVILDMHNWQDHAGVFGSQEWIDFWATTAQHYKNNNYVVAYEIFNEPFTSTWASWMVNGGAGKDGSNHDPWKALAQCVDAIRATGDTHTIVYPDPWFWCNGADIQAPQNFLNSGYSRSNIVVTMHEWYRTENINDRLAKDAKWAQYYPIWLGEINGWDPIDASLSPAIDTWTETMLDWFIDHDYGFSLWLHGKSRSEAWSIGENMLAGTSWSTSTPASTPSPTPSPTPNPTPSPSPVPVNTFEDGFETNNFNAWSGVSASTGETVTTTNTVKRTGSVAAEYTSNGGGGFETAYSYVNLSPTMNVDASGDVYVAQSGIGGSDERFYFIRLRTSSDDLAYAGWRNLDGVTYWSLMIRDGSSYVSVLSSASPQIGRWYNLELIWTGNASQGSATLKVDGVTVCSSTNQNTSAFGSASVIRFGLGELYNCGTTIVYGDNFSVS